MTVIASLFDTLGMVPNSLKKKLGYVGMTGRIDPDYITVKSEYFERLATTPNSV